MMLGDGFSRNPRDREALKNALEARNGDLSQMKMLIKGFDVEEHQSCEPWGELFEPPKSKRVTMASFPGAPPAEVLARLPAVKEKLPEPPVHPISTAEPGLSPSSRDPPDGARVHGSAHSVQ